MDRNPVLAAMIRASFAYRAGEPLAIDTMLRELMPEGYVDRANFHIRDGSRMGELWHKPHGADGKWHHYVIVVHADGRAPCNYIDGVQVC